MMYDDVTMTSSKANSRNLKLIQDQASKHRKSLPNSRPSSSQSRTNGQDGLQNGRPISRTSNQSNSRSHLTMTGDPTVDSDIADFIAARQRVLQNRQK